MIYLDNAATSFPKPTRVIDEMERCMRTYCANPGRSGHELAMLAGNEVFEAREELARFFNISDPLRISFCKNATEALNTAIMGTVGDGGGVITSCMEHNSVMRPLKWMESDQRIRLDIVGGNDPYCIDPKEFENKIGKDTRLIICTFSSNVNGVVLPIAQIGRIARENGIPFLVDASQGAGSEEIDVEKQQIDLLAFPGHKGLLGPQGTGGLYVRKEIPLRPLLRGGTGSDSQSMLQPGFMPDALESGTLNVPGIIGLRHGIAFIQAMGLEQIQQYKHGLTRLLHEGIREINGVQVFSRGDSGILAINFEGMDSSEAAYVLDREYGIAVRGGLHCAPIAHQFLGTTEQGIVRFSVGCFNTMDEMKRVLDAIRNICSSRQTGANCV